MSQFREYAESKVKRVAVVMDEYDRELLARLKRVEWGGDFIHGNACEKVAVEQTLLDLRYPRTERLMRALETTNLEKIEDAYREFQHWYDASLPGTLVRYKLGLYGHRTETDVDETFGLLKKKTTQNMHKVAKIVETAAENVGVTHALTVRPSPNEDRWFEPADRAAVDVSSPIVSARFGCHLRPGGLRIWEWDNPDAALDENLCDSYSRLVGEIGSPSGKRLRLMTVYFSAPPADRRMYSEARRRLSLYGNAELLPPPMREAVEPDEYRNDVWKARVDSGYLVETEPGLFNTVGGTEIPLRYLELIQEGSG